MNDEHDPLDGLDDEEIRRLARVGQSHETWTAINRRMGLRSAMVP